MTKKLSYEEIMKKFKNRKDIELIECKGWTKKSKFLDIETNEYFWATPCNVFIKNSSSRKRHMNNKKISFEEAKKRFIDQGRDDIELVKDGYIQWNKQAKFFDIIEQDYFTSLPYDVYKRGSVHPNRRKEKILKTNFTKFNVNNYTKTKEYKEKSKQTNLKKRGVEYATQCPKVKEKQKQTYLKNFGVENPMHCFEIVEKQRQTMLKTYNKEFYFQTEEFKEKSYKTHMLKFGVKSFAQTDMYKNLVSNRFIKEENMYLCDWYKLQPEPKPHYNVLLFHFPNEEIDYDELNKFIENYKNNKTRLEVFTENLFNIKHYNRTPKEIKKRYRPDFKLSDTVYVNVDSLYWHTEKQKGKWYHYNLRKEFEDTGLRIFQFYENELYNTPNIIKSIVHHSLNEFEKEISSEDCEVKIINSSLAAIFLNDNHLKGEIKEKNINHIGLYFNNELVSILSYKIINDTCKIENFCPVINTNIINNFSKLLDFLEVNFLNQNINEIHYCVDLRYEFGDFLLKNNFIKIKDELGYKWTNCEKIFELNKENKKLYKIWNAGQRLYIKKLQP